MAKKTSIKVRLVPESKPDSPFNYYVKKPSSGEKAKVKLKKDGWTVVTADKKLSAQWEHTIAVTKTGYEVLTLRHDEKPMLLN